MGKVLVEKLLRSCPGINKIYVLMRPKHGTSINERLKMMVSSPVSITFLFCHTTNIVRMKLCEKTEIYCIYTF